MKNSSPKSLKKRAGRNSLMKVASTKPNKAMPSHKLKQGKRNKEPLNLVVSDQSRTMDKTNDDSVSFSQDNVKLPLIKMPYSDPTAVKVNPKFLKPIDTRKSPKNYGGGDYSSAKNIAVTSPGTV